MLTPEDKDEWVVRLRSGEFQQGDTYLCAFGKYCCLGVFEEIKSNLRERSPNVYETKDVYPSSTMAGEYLQKVIGGKVINELIIMNDGIGIKRKTFPEIADWIEENL